MSPPTRALMSLTAFYVVCFLAKPASSFHGASMVARRGWREYHNARSSGTTRKSSSGSSTGTTSGASGTSSSHSSRSRSASKWEPARPTWWVARSPAALQGAPPSMAPGSITKGEFDHAQITDVLEHEYRAALVGLAQKYSELIESIEGVDTVSVKELDGDHMQLDVVYCDQGERTCVAVAVPVVFPYHCNDGDCVLGAIRDLEAMETFAPPASTARPAKQTVSPELMETIASISVVMNRDFTDELAIFVRAFGGNKIPDSLPLGRCEMLALTPDGFLVQAARFPDDPVQIAFSHECMCARDFQKQILRISEQSMEIMKHSMAVAA